MAADCCCDFFVETSLPVRAQVFERQETFLIVADGSSPIREIHECRHCETRNRLGRCVFQESAVGYVGWPEILPCRSAIGKWLAVRARCSRGFRRIGPDRTKSPGTPLTRQATESPQTSWSTVFQSTAPSIAGIGHRSR